jgi:hypothetical protein
MREKGTQEHALAIHDFRRDIAIAREIRRIGDVGRFQRADEA